MNATDWTVTLLWAGAGATTPFVVLYALTRPWWISWIGRALLTSSTGLMLLFDLSLFSYYHPRALTPTEGNVVVGVAVLGALLKLLALVMDLRQAGWRRRSA